MQMDIQKQEKKICIWLNKAESAELQCNAVLAPLFAELKKQKYTIAVFRSGTDALYDATLALLKSKIRRMLQRES